ncbi:MAG: PHP domain-containing protein [Victivallaceae bacterium]|nr:PHP domain-containing protein [Victivallaceae bacterium]
MRIDSDMHIHTSVSRCCRSPEQTIENVIRISAENGLKKIGFADHLWASDTVAPSDWYRSMNGAAHLRLHEMVHACQWDIEVLVGCEAETQSPGVFGITYELKAKLDFVVMSASHFHMKNFVEQPREITPRGIADHLLRFFVSAVSGGLPDAIVHPLFPFGYDNMYEAAINTISDTELTDALGIAAANNIGIEINPCSLPNPFYGRTFSLETPLRIFELAKKVGCKFTFGSDAHAPEEFKNLQKLQYFVDALNLTEDNLHSWQPVGLKNNR